VLTSVALTPWFSEKCEELELLEEQLPVALHVTIAKMSKMSWKQKKTCKLPKHKIPKVNMQPA
jgi:hypothetical protein